MKKKMKTGKIIFMALIFMMTIIIGNENVFAANHPVNDFAGLKTAITQTVDGDTITVDGNISLTETLVIENKKNITIKGSGTISAESSLKTITDRQNTLFIIKGSKVTFDGLTLDGASKNRIFYSENSNITLTSAKITNGCPGSDSNINPGGGIFLQGGSLTATNSILSNNKPGNAQGLKDGYGDKNGGAIYVGSTSADITINGGSFENNKVEVLGHGAAIYQNAGKLNIKDTKFKGNSGHYASNNDGTQGACIHTRENVFAEISNVNVEIAKGFNTGGFLRSYGSKIQVSGKSTFTIDNLGDNYGVSGGVFCFEGGTSSVVGATFECKGNSKVSYAGGFIDIVGSGTHTIDGNTMTGRGNDNNSAIASFGGAISVEQGAKAIVTIKGNTITNSTASDNGGAIAVGTYVEAKIPDPKPGEDPIPVETLSTVTMVGNKISDSGLIMWKGGAGGGVFVGKGSTVTVSGDEIKDTKAPYGGGVYNEGTLTINGKATLTGGIALSLGGEIYNNGDLTVDDATITGNFVGGAWWNGNPHPDKPDEYGGVNIYAEKDVTITPKANIKAGKDVRVLDGQSKILLTGPLTKEIDVSISEVAGGNETQKRRVGYVVAEGKDGYAATKSDANFLHYIGKNKKNEDQSLDMSHYTNQPRAAYEDEKSTGEWDFVLDKDNGKVVLGQRVKLIYHGNLGKIGSQDNKEKTVDVYKNPNFWENQLEEYQVDDPALEGSSFMGWYFWKSDASAEDEESSIQNIKEPNDFTNDLFDFSKVDFSSKGKNEIVDIIKPNVINTYAGWSKNIELGVQKTWENAEESEKVDVTATLKGGDKEEKITLSNTNNYYHSFINLSVFTKSYKPNEEKNMNLKFSPIEYSVVEESISGFTPSYSPDKIVANQVGEINSLFKVTNKKEKAKAYKVTYDFKVKDTNKEIPSEVTALLPSDTTKYEDKKPVTIKQPAKTSYEDTANNGTWTFKGWVKEDVNKDVSALDIEQDLEMETSSENPLTRTIKDKDLNFVGIWVFEAKTYNVTYEFKAKGTDKPLPQGIKDLLPKEETGKDNNTKVEPSTKTFADITTEDGTWTFNSWDADSKTINKADVKFIGTWTFAKKPEQKYKATYEFESGTTGKTLPAEIEGYKPTDATEYADKATVNAKQPTETSYKAEDGTWTFTKWDANSKTIDGADVKFVGKWTFTPKAPEPETKYKVTYEFTTSGTDKPLPQGVKDLLPEEETDKENGTKVEPSTKTFADVTTDEGTWTFKGWTPATATINKANVEFVGKWEFKADEPAPTEKYKVTYKFESGTTGKQIPTEVMKLLPQEETGRENKTHVTPVKLNKTEVKVTDGNWKFEGWAPLEQTINGKDVKFIGVWTFTKKEEPQPPIIPEKPGFNPFWPIYFGSQEKYEVSEKVGLNKEDHKAYMFGYPNWDFRPNSNMTRAEVTAMFARLLKNYPSTDVKYNLPYSDVFEGDWYYPAVGFMTENNIVKGYEDGTFRPNSPVTRAEFATIASKFEELIGDNVKGFSDVPTTHWALRFINSAYARGWVTGYEDGTFRPNRNITRAEVVTVTNKMLIRYADKEFVRANKDMLLHFKDLDESHWAYFNIMEATHGHDYSRRSNKLDEIWYRLNGEAFIFPDLKYYDK